MSDYPPKKINGQWVVPWIPNRAMFLAVSFSRSLLGGGNDFAKSIRAASSYYGVDGGTLAVLIRQVQQNIREASKIEVKQEVIVPIVPVTPVDNREPWEIKMDALEAVMWD